MEQQDITLATTLLAYGVHCDFEESDRPLPPDPFSHDYDHILWRGLEAEDLTPPLVRAGRLGNSHLARLLLAHGADANIAYHDLGGRKCDDNPHGYGYGYRYETSDSRIPAYFSCGRVIQLAMEMGHTELVGVLVDAGADTLHTRIGASSVTSASQYQGLCISRSWMASRQLVRKKAMQARVYTPSYYPLSSTAS